MTLARAPCDASVRDSPLRGCYEGRLRNFQAALNLGRQRAESWMEMSTIRYCPTCHTEVHDTGGFCLLGHVLVLKSGMDELRSSFDVGADGVPTEPILAAFPPPAPTVSPMPPPPPPIAPPPAAAVRTMWTAFEAQLAEGHTDEAGDPITSFAPAPRMDWGPERPSIFRRGATLLRRPTSASA